MAAATAASKALPSRIESGAIVQPTPDGAMLDNVRGDVWALRWAVIGVLGEDSRQPASTHQHEFGGESNRCS